MGRHAGLSIHARGSVGGGASAGNSSPLMQSNSRQRAANSPFQPRNTRDSSKAEACAATARSGIPCSWRARLARRAARAAPPGSSRSRPTSLASITSRHNSRSSISLRARGVAASWSCRPTYPSRSQPPKSRTRGVGQISRPDSWYMRSAASNSAAASSVFGVSTVWPAATAAIRPARGDSVLSSVEPWPRIRRVAVPARPQPVPRAVPRCARIPWRGFAAPADW